MEGLGGGGGGGGGDGLTTALTHVLNESERTLHVAQCLAQEAERVDRYVNHVRDRLAMMKEEEEEREERAALDVILMALVERGTVLREKHAQCVAQLEQMMRQKQYSRNMYHLCQQYVAQLEPMVNAMDLEEEGGDRTAVVAATLFPAPAPIALEEMTYTPLPVPLPEEEEEDEEEEEAPPPPPIQTDKAPLILHERIVHADGQTSLPFLKQQQQVPMTNGMEEKEKQKTELGSTNKRVLIDHTTSVKFRPLEPLPALDKVRATNNWKTMTDCLFMVPSFRELNNASKMATRAGRPAKVQATITMRTKKLESYIASGLILGKDSNFFIKLATTCCQREGPKTAHNAILEVIVAGVTVRDMDLQKNNVAVVQWPIAVYEMTTIDYGVCVGAYLEARYPSRSRLLQTHAAHATVEDLVSVFRSSVSVAGGGGGGAAAFMSLHPSKFAITTLKKNNINLARLVPPWHALSEDLQSLLIHTPSSKKEEEEEEEEDEEEEVQSPPLMVSAQNAGCLSCAKGHLAYKHCACNARVITHCLECALREYKEQITAITAAGTSNAFRPDLTPITCQSCNTQWVLQSLIYVPCNSNTAGLEHS